MADDPEIEQFLAEQRRYQQRLASYLAAVGVAALLGGGGLIALGASLPSPVDATGDRGFDTASAVIIGGTLVLVIGLALAITGISTRVRLGKNQAGPPFRGS